MYERCFDRDKSLFVVNRTPKYQEISIPKEYDSGSVSYTLKKSKKNVLSPYGGISIKK